MEIKFKQSTKKEISLESHVSNLASELMNAATSLHKLHLKITGEGSFAAHSALNSIYDSLPNHADTIIEEYQGASEMLLSYTESSPKTLNTVKEAISYLNSLKDQIDSLQKIMPYSEIVNQLDNVKSDINSAKYKLLFLK